jgi:hypothetical protein
MADFLGRIVEMLSPVVIERWHALDAAVSGLLTHRITERIKNRPVGKVLRLGPGDAVVILPQRIDPNRILPFFAVEDVYALKNVLALLNEMSFKGKIFVRDPDHIADVVAKNIISIGGPEHNSFTKSILSDIQKTIDFVTDFRPDRDPP